jgi:hypothetical protein
MRALVAALALLGSAVFAAVPVFEATPAARACSCPDCDPAAEADVVVSGWLTWTAFEDEPSDATTIPIDLEVRVDRVWRGLSPSLLHLTDSGSLSSETIGDEPLWLGGSGGCQAFAADPNGKYVLLGFDLDAPAPFRIFGANVWFVGERSDETLFSDALGRARVPSPPYPPATGDSPPAAKPTASNDWMFVSAIGAGSLLITLVLLLAGPKREPRDGSLRGSSNRPGPD